MGVGRAEAEPASVCPTGYPAPLAGRVVVPDYPHPGHLGDSTSVSPQDYCGQNSTGSFSIVTENVPCGTTGVTCSKAIKIFLGVSVADPGGGGPVDPQTGPVTDVSSCRGRS